MTSKFPVESWIKHSTIVRRIIDNTFLPEEKDVIFKAMDHAYGPGEPLSAAECRIANRLASTEIEIDDVKGWRFEAALRVVSLTRPLPAETRAMLCRCISFIIDPTAADEESVKWVPGIVAKAGLYGLSDYNDDPFERALIELMNYDHAPDSEENHQQFMARLRQEGVLSTTTE